MVINPRTPSRHTTRASTAGVSAAVVGANEAAMGIQGCSRVAAPQPIREKRLIPPKRLIKIALKKLSSLIDCRRTQKISTVRLFSQAHGRVVSGLSGGSGSAYYSDHA
jgi:hypothetical protein